jgi:hypothetical protein
MTMGPGLRKLALTTHVTSSVGWLGAVVGFLGNYSPYPVVGPRRTAWAGADQMVVELGIRSSGNVTVPGWSMAA